MKAGCTTFSRMVPEEPIPTLFTASKKQCCGHYVAGNSQGGGGSYNVLEAVRLHVP